MMSIQEKCCLLCKKMTMSAFVVVFMSLSFSASAGTVSGVVWNDINGDAKNDSPNNILTQADTSQPGDNLYGGSGGIAGVEAGYADVRVCIKGSLNINEGSNEVDMCTLTGGDGAFSFDLSSIDPQEVGSGVLALLYEAPEGYKFTELSPTHDHKVWDDGPPVPPAPWVASALVYNTKTVSGMDAGLEPLPQIKLSFFDTNADAGDGLQGYITGTAPFNVRGDCQTALPHTDPADPNLNNDTALTDPGDDCSKYDATVRSADIVTFAPSVTLDNSSNGIDNVIIEMQFSPKGGATITPVSASISQLPAGCGTGPAYSPESTVTTTADGSITLICNIGTLDNSAVFRTISVKPSGVNGSSFTTEMRAYAAGNNAVPSEEAEIPEITVSALPQYDITQNSYKGDLGKDGGSAANTSGFYPGKSRVNPVTGVTEQGVSLVHQVSIIVDGGGKGSSPLGKTFTFKQVVDPRYAKYGAEVEECSQDPWSFSWEAPWNGKGETPYKDDRTVDNGVWTCDSKSGIVTITGADTSGVHFPTKGANGTTTSPHKVIVTGYVSVWFPYSSFYRSRDPNWKDGDAPVLGTYPQLDCIADFDPNANDAKGNPVSNYGTGFEPGWDNATGTSSGNNCRATSYTISADGTFSKRYRGVYHQNEKRQETDRHIYHDAPNYHWACRTNALLVVPGQTDCDTGDGPIVAGQNFAAGLILDANSSAADLKDPRLCEAIDNATYKLAKIPAEAGVPNRLVGKYGYYYYNDSTAPGVDGGSAALGKQFGEDVGFIIEYARFNPANTTQKTWEIDHAKGAVNPNDGSIPIDNSQQQLAVKDCGDKLTEDGELEWNADPDNAGWSVDDIVMVRVRGKTPDSAIGAGDLVSILQLHFEARETFYTPNNAAKNGHPIPLGTLLPNVSNTGWDSDRDGAVNYLTGGYDATEHKGIDGAALVSYGDRLIFQTVNMGLDKQAYKDKALNPHFDSKPGDDDLFEVAVGDNIMWSLHPSVNSISDLSVAKEVKITDVLPLYAEYLPSCTPALPNGVSGPVIQPNTPNDGETTLVWTYDANVPANKPLDPIVFCTNTDAFAPAKPIFALQNSAKIEASNVVFVEAAHSDKRTVNLTQHGRFAIKKEVDFPLDFQNHAQTWKMVWTNTSDTFPFSPPDIIDVFPFNGDGPGSLAERELYKSEYNGEIELVAIPETPKVTTGAGAKVTDSGQWYVTCEEPGKVNADPTKASNTTPAGSPTAIWIAVQPSTTADPSPGCALADVSAIRWVSSRQLLALDLVESSFTIRTTGNEPNDIYVNRITGFSDSFGNPIKSNEPFVQVIGFSLGDLVWLDVNDNGVFDNGVDAVPPAPLTLKLFKGGNDTGLTAKTNEHGRWVFEKLIGDTAPQSGASSYVAGTFHVEFPKASLPIGWVAGPNPVTDPNNDMNETADHHAIEEGDKIRSSGEIRLAASVDGPGKITGDEPHGDNVALLGDPLVRDDLTNFTLDLMFVPVRGSVVVKKAIAKGAKGPLNGWEFALSTNDETSCPLPAGLSNPVSTDDKGEARFEKLLVFKTTSASGEKCKYSLIETVPEGWAQVTAQSGVTDVELEKQQSGEYLKIATVINSPERDLQILKSVDKDVAAPNSTLVFTITAKNNSEFDAEGVTVTDSLPTGFTYVSDSVSVGSYDSASGVWTIGTMAKKKVETLTLTVMFKPDQAQCDQTYTNTATISSTGSLDRTPDDNVATADVALTPLVLVKQLSQDSPVDLGDGKYQVTYNFLVANNGDFDLTKLQIEDDLVKMINTPHQNNASYKVTAVTSSDKTLTVNKKFDGKSIKELLSGSDTLPADASGKVEVVLEFTPDKYFGPFHNQASASAMTAGGLLISDLSEDGNQGVNTPGISVPFTNTANPDNGCMVDGPTPFNLIKPTTPITLGWFKSTPLSDSQVLFEWTTETEVANVGFNISVLNEQGQWRQINDTLILSKGESLSVQKYQYTGFVNDGTVFRISDVSVSGKEKHHGDFKLGEQAGVSTKRESIDWQEIRQKSDANQQKRDTQLKQQLKQRLKKPVTKPNEQSNNGNNKGKSMIDRLFSLAVGALLSPVQAAELMNFEVSESGIYRVSHQQLVNQGLDLRGVSATRLALKSANELVPAKFHVGASGKFAGGSYIEFPADAIETRYVKSNQYTLVIDEGVNFITGDASTIPPQPAPAAYSYLAEKRYAPNNHYTHLSPDRNGDAWYADSLKAINGAASKTINFHLDDHAPAYAVPFGGAALAKQIADVKPKIEVEVWGASGFAGNGVRKPDHQVVVELNNEKLSTTRFDGIRVKTINETLAGLESGKNQVKITVPKSSDYAFDLVNLDSVVLSYPRRFKAQDNGRSLVFESNWNKFRVRSLNSDNVTVYRVFRQNNTKLTGVAMTNVETDCPGGQLGCVAVFAGVGESKYYVSTTVKTPQFSIPSEQQELFAGQASVLVIAHPDFINTNGQLLESYAAELAGIYGSADIVSVSSIYAQYSGHVVDATAIQRYIKEAYQKRATRHLVLVGGDMYDYHNNLGHNAKSFVPSLYMPIAMNLNSVPSDAKYADVVNDDNIPDITVTRLPVRTQGELRTLLNKRQSYLSRNYSTKAVFSADKSESSGYDFSLDSETVVKSYFANWQVTKAYIDDLGVAAANQQLKQALNQGVALTSYYGHSSVNHWSQQGLISGEEVASLANSGRPTVVAQWGCWNTFYASPEEESLANRFLLEGDRGAVVVMGATSLTKAAAEKKLSVLLFDELTQGKRIADAVLAAKQRFAQDNPYQLDILLAWTVLGPADMTISNAE